MSAAPAKAASDEAPAAIPQTPPPSIGMGHPEYHFMQIAMELQKSIGKVESSVDALKASIDSTKSKVDVLVEWKNMIIGGAAVLGIVITVLVFAVNKFSDYITFKSPASTQMNAPSPSTPPQAAQPAKK